MTSLIARLVAGLLAVALLAPLVAAADEPARPAFASSESVLHFIQAYRSRPEPARVPAAVRKASETGALARPDAAGLYVGFLAGVIATQPTRAEKLVAALIPFPQEDAWVIIRAIAYSGHPDWKGLLARNAARFPQHDAMIEAYVNGRLPTLARLAIDDDPSVWARMRGWFRFGEPAPRTPALAVGPDVLDTLWGVYFATGDAAPVERIVALLPWSQERDDLGRLTVGCMAKFTVVANAAHDPALLALLRTALAQQPPAVAAVLKDAIQAAETTDVGRVRKEAIDAIRALETSGPAKRRESSFWGRFGDSVVSLGCAAAGAFGRAALGLPCVSGGAVAAALQ
ncbi:hypothetical protein PQJ75_19355 [Rhodoplanes sp. TEM]|uniref:HEAT repeat domain-containing protein n=1 Tax=Rhodoplanes tepidamans TaxID=200616 RepID=A0ABT5JHL5_RHOTP|nr:MULTISPECIES: hypothetical protein [Rhodoplanes]MDC7789092.1 hypothetical protein [Rhodoplanes tepidamans]MDC7985893.1 hypothetical protein [Rhodoplanes sp. TEM]MDQ0354422.1 hypothetical protein [Rhodoplanes tepidamans]